MKLSLIDNDVLNKNPKNLVYLYPSMPKIRLAEKMETYYRAQTIRAAEQAAFTISSLLVPASCIHYKRRDQNKRVVLFGRSYYIVRRDQMTYLEMQKYVDACGGDDAVEA